MRSLAAKPFSHFLALSVALHALVLSEWMPVYRPDPSPGTVISAELVALPAEQPQAAVPPPTPPIARPTPRSLPRIIPIAPEPNAMSMPATASDPPKAFMPTESEQTAEADAEPDPAAEPPPVAEASEPQTPTPVSSAAPTPIRPVRDLPPTGSQSYEVFIGASRLHIGRTHQTWTIGEQTYRLSSSSETTGFAAFLRPYQLDYVSEGRVDASGFQPESFSVRRGRNGARQYGARFDWEAKELTLGPLSAPRKVALPAGTLDVLAFIYQLARAPLEPGRFEVSVTTGNRLETYTVEVGAEEDIEVPTGTMRALPVRQLRKPGQEAMEIWLAPERSYMPVRIRFLDRNGEISGEQLAADIAFNAK